jgi:Tol biopolymer transport system component
MSLPVSSGAADRVSYTSSRPAGWDIYLFERTGAAPRRLTTDPGLDYDAVVSPNGRWVVFTSERHGGPDLYALDLQADDDPLLLLESDALEDQVAFSPDGESIAFVGSASGNAEIYLLPFRPRRTSSMRDARNLTSHPGGDFRPAFSPDGRKLAFSSDRDLPVEVLNPITRFRSGDIYVLDLTGAASPQRLTDAPGWDGSPAWSPDGRSIAFYSERNPGNRLPGISGDQPASIAIMNADGSQQRTLTSAATTALSPAFLPDDRILFARRPAIAVSGAPRGATSAAALASMYEDGAWEIASIASDGSDERIESDG